MICEHAGKPVLRMTPESQQAMNDFVLAAQVNITLADQGHFVDVACEQGRVLLSLTRYVLRFEHYKDQLTEIVSALPGVQTVEMKYCRNVDLPTLTRNVELEPPPRVLLVDDEIELVHTLSERLRTRKMETSVVYDGEEALSVVAEQEPEVMILDLKMPGIDGIEVLRKVKATKPHVEVIILTGHGSQKERDAARELGAFAYLEKPVDIDILTQTLQDAYGRVSKRAGPAGDAR